MPNKRDPNKIKVQTWMSKADKAALEKVAKEKGFLNLADFLAAIAKGLFKLALIDALVRFAFSFDPVSSLLGGVCDAATIGYYGACYAATGIGYIVAMII